MVVKASPTLVLKYEKSFLRNLKWRNLLAALTAEKMKFSIKDFFNNVTKSAGNCGFGHIY